MTILRSPDGDMIMHWIIPFTIVDSFNRVFYGMFGTLLGPSQPYLAKAVGVDIDTITWIYPFGKVGFFKKYVKLSFIISPPLIQVAWLHLQAL